MNTLCQKFVRPTQVEPTTQKLIMWNKSKVNPLGETTLKITNPKNEEETVVDFIVVPNDYSGCPKRLSTAWVSQMAVVKKPNGSLRICIDPQPLNAALQREHYKLPTLDDVLPSLSQARVFSKLDVKQAYWHVQLDNESSLLATMITPFGRYRWARLPFGLKVSSEIFQRKLNEALVGLNGVICIADDLVVYGSGNTREEADVDHEQNLLALQERCAEKRVKLNDEKTVLK